MKARARAPRADPQADLVLEDLLADDEIVGVGHVATEPVIGDDAGAGRHPIEHAFDGAHLVDVRLAARTGFDRVVEEQRLGERVVQVDPAERLPVEHHRFADQEPRPVLDADPLRCLARDADHRGVLLDPEPRHVRGQRADDARLADARADVEDLPSRCAVEQLRDAERDLDRGPVDARAEPRDPRIDRVEHLVRYRCVRSQRRLDLEHAVDHKGAS